VPEKYACVNHRRKWNLWSKDGEIILEEDLRELAPEERAHKGVFLSFQYPVEIPGVSVTNFIRSAINETRKANGEEDMPANEMLKVIREKSELLEIDRKFCPAR
jgi:Fe-S cluster assembly ATP-binding protein